jgi:hypothetical protein
MFRLMISIPVHCDCHMLMLKICIIKITLTDLHVM